MRDSKKSHSLKSSPSRGGTKISCITDPAAIAQTFHNLIESAQRQIIFQMYLFAGNGELETLQPKDGAFPWARLFADWLIARRKRSPDLTIAVLLDTQTPDDPRLTRLGRGPLARHVLEEAGIPVLNANLFDNTFNRARRFPAAARFHEKRRHSVAPERWVQAQQRWQLAHNVEDHRKNIVIDQGAWGAITSHNAIDIASDWHENMFLIGEGPASLALWEEGRSSLSRALELPQRIDAGQREQLLEICRLPAKSRDTKFIQGPEQSVLRALGDPFAIPEARRGRVSLLSSKEILPCIIQAADALGPGDSIRVASTYFSDAQALRAFASAAKRRVSVRILIDDCAGLPLKPLLSLLLRTFVSLRCRAYGRRREPEHLEVRVHRSLQQPMMHLKTAAFLGKERLLIGGQANYTPNSFSGAWLETNLLVEESAAVGAFLEQFDDLWNKAEPLRPPEHVARSGFLSRTLRNMSEAGGRIRLNLLLGILGIFERFGIAP